MEQPFVESLRNINSECDDWRLVSINNDGTIAFDRYRYGRRVVLTAKIENLESVIY